MEDRKILVTALNKRKVARNTYEVSFRLGKKAFPFNPGQYLNISIPQLLHPDPRGNKRDFSIASSPNHRSLTIVFRASNSGFKKTLLETKRLKVEISGPFGIFTLPEDKSVPIICIAGGIGITPFLSMLEFIVEEKLPYKITLLYVNKSKETAVYLDKLQSLKKKNPNFIFKTHFGHLSPGVIQNQITEIDPSYFLIAGPPPMVLDTQRILMKFGIKEQNIKTEEFSGYKDIEIEGEDEAGGSLTTIPGNAQDIEQASNRVGKEGKLGEGIEGELSQRSLSDLEALLQALSNTALVSETNSAGTITFANDKFVEISKYSRKELIGQNHRILKSGYHTKAFYENLWATITRGRLWRGVIKNKAKDESFYWVDTSIAPILGRDAKPIKYISVRFPITERQQAEEQLRHRANQQSVLTILSQEALASSDLPSLFETAIALLAQTLGVEYCAVLKLLPAEQNLIYEAGVGIMNAVKGKTTVSSDSNKSMAGLTLSSKESVVMEDLATESRFVGSEFLHDNRVVSGVSVIIHGTDNPFGTLEVCSTKKRSFSQEDINFIQAVANLLANAARNQLDKRKDEFLGIASHELKTPLTSIKTFIQLLQTHAKKQKDERSMLFLSKTGNQIDRLTDLIGDLLDISKINAGKINYKDEEFTINEVLEEIVQEQRLFTKKHTITLNNGIETKVFGDKDRIGQVLTNLLNNAVKYSPNSEKIIVEAQQDKDKVIVSVRDFGVGVPETEKERIFDRFYQGNGQKRNNFPGGLGLGLYICQEIVKRHHGQIWVESEGKGSKFSFSLPVMV